MSVIPHIQKAFPLPLKQSRATATRHLLVRLVLFSIGFATFVNLYVTQPLLPKFMEIFNASELLVSLTVSAPVLGVALTAPLVGLLADSIGRKGVIFTAMLCLSIPTFLVATAHSLPALIVWRFFQGVFISSIITVTMAYISEESPVHLAGITMATYVTGTVVGGFSGRLVAGLFATHGNWQAAFVLFGLITLGITAAVGLLLPRSTHFTPRHGEAAFLSSLRRHLGNSRLLATYALGFNVLFCLVATFTYINFHLSNAPFSLGPAALGSIFTVYLVGAVITPVAGILLDRIGYRKTLSGAVSLICLGILGTLVPSIPLVIAGLALAATGVFVCQCTASSYVGKAAGRERSSAAGLYVSLYYLGGGAGSILPGLFWRQAGWGGCVGLVLCLQMVILTVANRWWQDDPA